MRRKPERMKMALSHYKHVQQHGSEYCSEYHRRAWMSDEQWRQTQECLKGTAVPTDVEIKSAFANMLNEPHTRGELYVYSNVPSILLECWAEWCELIIKHYAPHLMLDVGL